MSGPQPDDLADESVRALEGIADPGWYSGLIGREVTAHEAVRHYLQEGRRLGLTLHPLIDGATLMRSRDRIEPGSDPVVQYALRPELRDVPTHPLLATASYVRRHPEALDHPGGPPQHWLEVGRPRGDLPGGWWTDAERVLPALAVWHRRLAGLESVEPRPAGEPVVLVRHDRHLGRLRRLLESLEGQERRRSGTPVLLTTAGLGRGASLQAASFAERFEWLVVDLVPEGTDRVDAWSRLLGEAGPVVLLEGDVVVTDGWLEPLLAAIDDPGVARAGAVLLAGDGTIGSAGRVRCELDGRGVDLLEGFAADEPEPGGTTEVAACPEGAVALRVQDLLAGGGIPSGRVVVCHDSRVVLPDPRAAGPPEPPPPTVAEAQAWRALGLEVSHGAGVHRATPIPRAGSLRWAIKCPAPAGRTGDRWGDVYFAEELARGLRAEGQHVVVDRADAFDRPTAGLDDVTLLIRGLRAWRPAPDATSLMWVISHPEEVDAAEVAGLDAVLVASDPWAAEASRRWRRTVLPLPQAVDAARFHPGLAEPDTGPEVVFVGGFRPPARPLVDWALEAGLPLAVYGHGWEGRLPPGVLRSERVSRDEVGALYRSAGLVLCDHWEDMAQEGFIQNRVFDVVAAGGRAVSDPVAGLADVLPGVVEVRGADALREVFHADRTALFGSDEQVRDRAAWVAEHHSFRARARTLVALVRELRASGRPVVQQPDE